MVEHSELKKGIIHSLIFYVVGTVLTIFAYFVFDNSYIHGPNLYMIIALGFVAVGSFIGLISLIKYFFFARHQRHLGASIIHSFVLVSFLLWIYFGLVNST